MNNSPATNREIPGIFTLVSSLLIAVLTIVASFSGLLSPALTYPSEALRQFALANDVTNLLLGVPILLLSILLDRRGKYLGRLLWPGALMYTLYNYLAYVVALPVTWLYLAYLWIVALCVYAMVATFMQIDRDAAGRHLNGMVPNRLAGAVLMLLGSFVFLRVFGVIINAQIRATEVTSTDQALLIADVLLAPAWIIGGVLLWKKQPWGYAAGLALLFQGSMLFIGLIIVLALQPIFSSAATPWMDILVVATMGMICFVPFALFLRGTTQALEAAHAEEPAPPES